MGFLHIRLREGRDDDIAAWYSAQDDKSEAVRKAIRAYIRSQNGESQEAAVRDAVTMALASLPVVVASAVREALANYQLAPTPEREPGQENPELAARLDAKLDDFFEG